MQDRRPLIQKRARLLRTRRMAVGGGGAATNLTAGFASPWVGYHSGNVAGFGAVAAIGEYTAGNINGFELGAVLRNGTTLYITFEGNSLAAMSGVTISFGGNDFALDSGGGNYTGGDETFYYFYGSPTDSIEDGVSYTLAVS